jgi:hypothetical protein
MRQKMYRSVSLTMSSILCLMAFNKAALAGPPLICHPFDIGSARSLPWSGPGWRDIDKSYNTSRLVVDTLALLTPETPVLVRMETLRRATVYGLMPSVDITVTSPVKDPIAASELLSNLKARLPEAGEKSVRTETALALFDYGYLIETYRQGGDRSQGPRLAGEVDGYEMIVKAISLRRGSSEMEFAAALASEGKRQAGRNVYVAHLHRSAEGAQNGSLLARNLLAHFGHMGKTLNELRSVTATAKN